MTNYFVLKAKELEEEINNVIFKVRGLGIKTAVCYDYVCSSATPIYIENIILPLSILVGGGAAVGVLCAAKLFIGGPIMQLIGVASATALFGGATGIMTARSYVQLYKYCDCKTFTMPNRSLDASLESIIMYHPNDIRSKESGIESRLGEKTASAILASKKYAEKNADCNEVLQKQMENSFTASVLTKDYIDIAGNNTAEGEEVA